MLAPGFDFDFSVILSNGHPTLRVFNHPDVSPYQILRYGEFTFTHLEDLPQTLAAAGNQPSNLTIRFGSNNPASLVEVMSLNTFDDGVVDDVANLTYVPNGARAPGGTLPDNPTITLFNRGTEVARGVWQSLNIDATRLGTVTGPRGFLVFQQAVGSDPTIFNEIQSKTANTGRIRMSSGRISSGGSVGIGDAEFFTASAQATLVVPDTIPPTADIIDVTPDPHKTNAGIVTIKFSEPVTGVDIGDFTLTRNGAPVSLSGLTVFGSGIDIDRTLDLSNVTKLSGSYVLTLNASGSGIQDEANNLISVSASDSWLMDTIAPAADIVDISPDPRNTNAGTVTINFSEPVVGVHIGYISLTRNGSNVGLGGLSIAGSGSRYTLNLSSVTSAPGSYVLRLRADSLGIRDLAGNLLASDASDSWTTIDTTPPTADIIDISPDPRNTATGNIRIVFGEPVTGVDLADFSLTRDGNPIALSKVSFSQTGDGTEYNINLSSITSAVGSYVLTLNASNTNIKDAAGNTMVANAIESWIVELTPPTVDIVDVTPDPRSTSAGKVTINFNEPVTGVSGSSFSLTRNGMPVQITGPLAGTGSSYTLDLSNATKLAGQYEFKLRAAGSTIRDIAGNAITSDAVDIWTTDTTIPTADIIDVTPDPRNVNPGILTINFSEPVTGVDISDFTLTRNGAPASLNGLTVTGAGSSYAINLSNAAGNPGSYALTLKAAGSEIRDVAGNFLAANANDNWAVVPNFTVEQTNFSTLVSESGTTDTLSIGFTVRPASNVVLKIVSSDTTEATVSPSTLTFTSANWSTTQTVTIRGVDDFVDDGDQHSWVVISIDDARSDDQFHSLPDQQMGVQTINNDVAGFTIAPSGASTIVRESGTTDTFTVVLTSQPASNVLFSVSSDDATETSVSPRTLTFTPQNWNAPRVVTVAGVDDVVADRDQLTGITIAVDDANSDDGFDLLADQSVDATTLDNETLKLAVVQTNGSTVVSETGTTDAITVTLTAQPLTHIVFSVANDDQSEFSIQQTFVGFTYDNWNIPQTIVITGVDDSLDDDLQVSKLRFSVMRFDDPGSAVPPDEVVNITTIDDDAVNISSSTKIGRLENGGPALTEGAVFGHAAASLGDLDQDGVSDVAVGAQRHHEGKVYGEVHVLMLNANGTAKSYSTIGSDLGGAQPLSQTDFGCSIASIGDLDGDGVNDLAVGATFDQAAPGSGGAVYILMLNADGTVKSSVKIASNSNGGPFLAARDAFGCSLAALGDLDGDGLTDLAVGALGDYIAGDHQGAVHLLMLNANGTVKNKQKITKNTNGVPFSNIGGQFGNSMAALGDLNGDGVVDLAVGAHGDDTAGSFRGAVHVLFLNANGSIQRSVKITEGSHGGPRLADLDAFAGALSAIGDVDGNGAVDLAVGATGDDSAGSRTGAVYVLLLNGDGTAKSTMRLVSGGHGGLQLANAGAFGNSVASLGDMNNDGVTDLLVGALLDENADGISSSGAVHVVFMKSFTDTLDITLSASDSAHVARVGEIAEVRINNSPDSRFSIPAESLRTLRIHGGSGNNLIDLSSVTTSAFPSLIGVTVSGNEGNDTIIGSSLADELTGDSGDDQLTGGDSSDILNGGSGVDLFRDTAYSDFASGQRRSITLTNDALVVAFGATLLSTDSLLEVELADLTGGLMPDIITATGFTAIGVTTLNGGGGPDIITGTPGVDLIYTLSGADSINGNGGGDTVFSGGGNDTINGGEGNDVLTGQNGNDLIFGDDGVDQLVGGAGQDSLNGGAGNDFLSGQADGGLLNGGDGDDLLQGSTSNDTLNGDAGNDRLVALQGDDILSGGDGADTLFGSIGNDILNGGAGADDLRGEVGSDSIDGGAGIDRINEVFDTNVTISGVLAAATIAVQGGGTDSVINVDRINLIGGAYANLFDARTTSLPVLLSGEGGNDTLLGGSNADVISGGLGDDVLSGGASADLMDGGLGTDYVYEKADTDFTIAGATITSVMTGTDTPAGIERIALVGGSGANRFDAERAAVPVVLIGGRGNDTLIGGASADTLSGGNRNDTTVAGGDGVDSLTSGAGTDMVESDPLDLTPADAGDTLLVNVFNLLPNWIDSI